MPEPIDAIKEAASRWVPRLAAGLTASEEKEFEAWIEADSRHASMLAQQQAIWDRFGSLVTEAAGTVPDADRYRARPARKLAAVFFPPLLATAAAVVLGVFLWRSSPPSAPQPIPSTRTTLPAPLAQHVLPDASVVELNRGAEIAPAFTATARRVDLLKGEASFVVAKNPIPFVVSVGGVEVRAIGTAFNVRYDLHTVEVVVTEGKVQVVLAADRAAFAASSLPVLTAGQSTTIALKALSDAPHVATLTSDELAARIAWQSKLLDFDDAPLADIVAEFNRRNPVHLVLRDPAIQSLRLNGTFRSDNMEGFVRLLESHFGIQTESLNAGEIGLRRRN
jgi:transmembrane sensor